ncbi:MAG TPA: tetratricopeptide repeat protein [Longimicrobiales bacterium]|nr:tetratricopeptide repeat protein [Longimicrobiales bacterium]
MSAIGRWLVELKRRKVFRVGVVYGAIALAVADGADSLLAPLGAPPWVQTTIAALAVAGFPVALILAWLYELTPDGLRRTASREGSAADVRAGWAPYLEASLLLAVLVAGVWLLGFARNGSPDSTRGARAVAPGEAEPSSSSLAVLPFDNLSADSEDRYFADGLAIQLLDELARAGPLQVAAWSSSTAFRDSTLTVGQIGRALNVGSVVNGSVRRSAERLRITVALTDVESGFNVWSTTFDEAPADVFAIQDAIAREIVRQLRGRLLPDDSAGVDVARTRSLAAFDSYLQGIDKLRLRLPDALNEARELFERAIDIDPAYAKAYAGLAEAYYHLSTHDATSPTEQFADRAKQYGRLALELDPLSADAHAVMGAVAFQIDLAFDEAERALREAIRLNPSAAAAHQWLGETLLVQGRLDDAATTLERAAELDPLSPMPELLLGFTAVLRGDVDRGVARWQALGERYPEFAWAPLDVAWTLLVEGDGAGAIEFWHAGARRYHAADPDAAERLGRGMDWIVEARREPERRAEAVRYWQELPADVTLQHWRFIALTHLDTEAALAVLRDMRDRRDPLFVYSNIDLMWSDTAQDLRRLEAFLESSGIPALPAERFGSWRRGDGDL